MNRAKSDALHHEALSHLVGGVNSPFGRSNPFTETQSISKRPPALTSRTLTETSGRLCPVMGAPYPRPFSSKIIEAVHEKMLNGTSFGAPPR